MDIREIEETVLQYDEMGELIVELVTCGACGATWNGAAISSITPAPAARCPFEYDHA